MVNEIEPFGTLLGAECLLVSVLTTRAYRLPIDDLKGFAYCPNGVQWFKDQGRWHTANPQPGDIVFYDFHGQGVEHTGIVNSVSQSSITAIEGNTSDGNPANGGAVQEKPRSNNRLNNWAILLIG